MGGSCRPERFYAGGLRVGAGLRRRVLEDRPGRSRWSLPITGTRRIEDWTSVRNTALAAPRAFGLLRANRNRRPIPPAAASSRAFSRSRIARATATCCGRAGCHGFLQLVRFDCAIRTTR